LWSNDAAGWTNLGGPTVGYVTFGDGSGAKRVPEGDNGFAFTNGITDIAALFGGGPVVLGGVAPADAAQPKLWLLALKMTDDGKGIVANAPIIGKRVILAYDSATKTVGGVVGTIDLVSGKVTMLSESAAGLVVEGAPADAGDRLKAFSPASYFTVGL
jgi:hypothetical protein